ncbi:MAG: hypothetical protein Q8938_06945, partial [Bacteroidota bacterium]|nr:hypothetical protein [Bacteroidota bacterium]
MMKRIPFRDVISLGICVNVNIRIFQDIDKNRVNLLHDLLLFHADGITFFEYERPHKRVTLRP